MPAPAPTIRVLIIDQDVQSQKRLAAYLEARSYQVETALGVEHASDVLARWRPHVLLLVPQSESERHRELERLRRIYPRVPVVLVTAAADVELLIDIEAFAPTLPATPARGLGYIEATVAAAARARAA